MVAKITRFGREHIDERCDRGHRPPLGNRMMTGGEDQGRKEPVEPVSNAQAVDGQAGDAQDRREGRGRLSSIDMLPDEAEPEILWALEKLRERKLPQTAILAEFNERLADRGMAPVSKSAWSRYAVRKAVQFRRHDEARKMSAELVGQLGTEGADEVTVMLGELIKVAMFDLLERGDLGSKAVMEMARGLSAVVTAQKTSADHRAKLQEEVQRKLKEAAAAAARAGKKTGVSAETLAEINRALGVQ